MRGFQPAVRRVPAQNFADGGFVQSLKDGGPVRGPGTGTSDSIAARLSDGEYVLPADTVQAIGVPALDAAPSLAQRASQSLRDFTGVGAGAGESTGFLGKAARALGRTGTHKLAQQEFGLKEKAAGFTARLTTVDS